MGCTLVTPDPTRRTMEMGSEPLPFAVLPENAINTHEQEACTVFKHPIRADRLNAHDKK